MPVSGPGMPDTYQATIIDVVYDAQDKTKLDSIKLSKISDAGGSGSDYLIENVGQIRPQNSVGFPIDPLGSSTWAS